MSTAEGGAGSEKEIETSQSSPTDNSIVKDRIKINELATFKSSKELYPVVQPYIDIQPKGGKSKL